MTLTGGETCANHCFYNPCSLQATRAIRICKTTHVWHVIKHCNIKPRSSSSSLHLSSTIWNVMTAAQVSMSSRSCCQRAMMYPSSCSARLQILATHKKKESIDEHSGKEFGTKKVAIVTRYWQKRELSLPAAASSQLACRVATRMLLLPQELLTETGADPLARILAMPTTKVREICFDDVILFAKTGDQKATCWRHSE